MSQDLSVGDRVRLISQPPFIKTADPMPMLRPSTVVTVGEEGLVIDRRPGGYWSIRFTNGTYLLDSQYLEVVIDT
ncbi:MAG: DUF3148 domain-containing protein [Kovacikia sp.]